MDKEPLELKFWLQNFFKQALSFCFLYRKRTSDAWGLFSMCHACLKSNTPVSIVLILFLPNASASVCFFATIKYVVADFFTIRPSKQIGAGVLYNMFLIMHVLSGAFKASKYTQIFQQSIYFIPCAHYNCILIAHVFQSVGFCTGPKLRTLEQEGFWL